MVKFLCEDGDERAATQLLLTLKEFISHIETAVTKYHTLTAKARLKAAKDKGLHSSMDPSKKKTPFSNLSPMIANKNQDTCTSTRNQSVNNKDFTPLLRPKFLFSSTTPHSEQVDPCPVNQRRSQVDINLDTNNHCRSIDPRSALMQSIIARRQDADSDNDAQDNDNVGRREDRQVKPTVDARSALMQSIIARRQDADSDNDAQENDNVDHGEDRQVKPVVDARSALMQSIIARRQDADSDNDAQVNDNVGRREDRKVKPVVDARSALMQSIIARRQE